MILQIADDYRINVSAMNFTLEQKHVTEARGTHEGGKEVWKTLGYYSGLESALRALPDHLALDPTVQTLEDYIARWAALAKDIGGRFSK